jgi:LysM repeat protein
MYVHILSLLFIFLAAGSVCCTPSKPATKLHTRLSHQCGRQLDKECNLTLFCATSSAGALAQARTCGTHTIRAGDTFWKVSQEKGLSLQAVQQANPGVSPESLKVGQRINLPCSSGGAGAGAGECFFERAGGTASASKQLAQLSRLSKQAAACVVCVFWTARYRHTTLSDCCTAWMSAWYATLMAVSIQQ